MEERRVVRAAIESTARSGVAIILSVEVRIFAVVAVSRNSFKRRAVGLGQLLGVCSSVD